MQTDMTVKDKVTRLCALIGVCSLGIYLAACDNGELPAGGEGTEKVELRFSASISDSPSTKAGQPPQPTTTPANAFETGTHLFGLFVTREDGSALSDGSGDNDNMKSTLTVGSKPAWTHLDKTDTRSISLAANNGENIFIKGYYPWTEGATATAVPFDLSSTDPTKWKDLLYLSSPAPTEKQNITDGMGPIALKFSHAFCWVTINLLQLSPNNTVQVKAVTIGNAYAGQGTIFNKGKLNLNTGVIDGISGPLKIEMAQPITLDTKDEAGAQPSVFNFLVPPVMSPDIKNSDIVIEVTTVETEGDNNVEKVLTFPLSLSHLNNEGSSYGFAKGQHNTYDIVYNNSAMNLSLSDWQTVTITDKTLGEGMASAKVATRTFNQGNTGDIFVLGLSGLPSKSYQLANTDHKYTFFLGEVKENNNGSYVTALTDGKREDRWKDVILQEPVYPSLKIAENLAAGGAQLPWKDEDTGALLAKQACVECRDGGYSDWRLPRIGECWMLYIASGVNIVYECWSGTESDEEHSLAMVKEKIDGKEVFVPKKFSKKEQFYVRCVRDNELKN